MLTQFRWLLPSRLAGSGQPGLLAPIEEDWAHIQQAGIGLVVTLTEDPLEPRPEHFGIQGIHFPILDMGVPPTTRTAHGLVQTIVAAMDEELPVLVHCKAGIGRTGTVLACCLVAVGQTADEALLGLRRRNPRYIQTEMQEEFVVHYGRFLGGERQRASV